MNFLIKSEQHRATSRYYYLSHRSIRRIAVVHDDLQITPKQLCAGTSPADIHLYRGSLWQKKIPRDEDTCFVRGTFAFLIGIEKGKTTR